MLLWVYVGLMTVAALAAVLWPLWRRRAASASGTDVAVYRDQLQEIDRDLSLGLIPAAEAEAARVEVSRRLLAASQAGEPAPAVAGGGWQRNFIAGLAVLVLTIGAAGLYLRVGSPLMASESAPAKAEATATIDRLVAQAEEYLTKNPRDARGWEVLAPVYMRVGRYSDSANAWRNTIQLAGENADRLANLGEALTAESGGIVTADAKDAFTRAVALDQTTVTARFYLGVAAEQDGQASEATKLFKQLIADSPPNSPWLPEVRTALARVEGKPDGAQLKPLARLNPQAQPSGTPVGGPQDPSVLAMVGRLAERLKQDGSDPDGWVRLVRSYGVLNDEAKKQGAIDDARKALAGDAERLAKFESGLKALEAGEPPAGAPPHASAAAGAPATQGDGVQGMVDRLAERLKKDGSDPDGWVRLVRSYEVLKDEPKKNAAIADARKALAGDAEKLARFDSGLKAIAAGEDPPPLTSAAAVPEGKDAAQHEAESMTERLAQRLQKSGSDPEGWLMLTRSYTTLQQPEKAKAAVQSARTALAAAPEKLQWFNDQVKRFKLE
jgi:cytochrome c-type biogenesis protein CcmH